MEESSPFHCTFSQLHSLVPSCKFGYNYTSEHTYYMSTYVVEYWKLTCTFLCSYCCTSFVTIPPAWLLVSCECEQFAVRMGIEPRAVHSPVILPFFIGKARLHEVFEWLCILNPFYHTNPALWYIHLRYSMTIHETKLIHTEVNSSQVQYDLHKD